MITVSSAASHVGFPCPAGSAEGGLRGRPVRRNFRTRPDRTQHRYQPCATQPPMRRWQRHPHSPRPGTTLRHNPGAPSLPPMHADWRKIPAAGSARTSLPVRALHPLLALTWRSTSRFVWRRSSGPGCRHGVRRQMPPVTRTRQTVFQAAPVIEPAGYRRERTRRGTGPRSASTCRNGVRPISAGARRSPDPHRMLVHGAAMEPPDIDGSAGCEDRGSGCSCAHHYGARWISAGAHLRRVPARLFSLLRGPFA